jgi:hypothetical protein
VWKKADGDFATTPEAFCPDAQAYRVRIEFQQAGPNDPGVYECYPVAVGAPLWPCR